LSRLQFSAFLQKVTMAISILEVEARSEAYGALADVRLPDRRNAACLAGLLLQHAEFLDCGLEVCLFN
jgi:hypothetical protein